MIAIVDAVDADADGDGGYSVDVDADGDGNRWTVFFWTRGAWRIVAIHTGALFGSWVFGELIKIALAQSSVFGKFFAQSHSQRRNSLVGYWFWLENKEAEKSGKFSDSELWTWTIVIWIVYMNF